MNNVINFSNYANREIKILWKLNNRVRPWWRLTTAEGQLLPFPSERLTPAKNTVALPAVLNSGTVRKLDYDTIGIDREAELQDLVCDIDRETDRIADLACTDPDSSGAEFCGSFAYGDADPDDILRELDYEADGNYDTVVEYCKGLPHRDLFKFLSMCGSAEDHIGYRRVGGSLFSYTVGEISISWDELPESLQDRFDALTELERAFVINNFDSYYDCDGFFVDCSNASWHFVIDFEAAELLIAERHGAAEKEKESVSS